MVYSRIVGQREAPKLNAVNGIAIDSTGSLFIQDSGNYTVRKMTPAGTNWVVTTIGGLAGVGGNADGIGATARFNYAELIVADSAGNVYVADRVNNTIRKGEPFSVTQPSFTNVQFNNGRLTATVVSLAGWNTVILQSSTNLNEWQPIQTNTVSSPTLSITNLIDPSSPALFLRAAVQ
jgi:hypothetical protein